MEYEILGSTMPALVIRLGSGESVYTEAGAMAWMSESIDMHSGFRGGLLGTVGRWFSGESVTMTSFTAERRPGEVAFVPAVPGRIIPVQMKRGRALIAQAGGFLCAGEGVDLKVHLKRKLWAGLFGGEGFILQRVSGEGMAFFEIDGEVVEKELAPGEVLRVDTGHVALFEEGVEFDITTVKGVRNWLFGGEGLFLATLRGPGKVWLQTMPFINLVGQIAAAMPQQAATSDGVIPDLFGD
ncbi:MAG TPA: TIGR00266 family protein [Symbiobacteriaceae bacterium]|nr:TIGR00266 family protein [Symbiobacteriaceae bacterium]